MGLSRMRVAGQIGEERKASQTVEGQWLEADAARTQQAPALEPALVWSAL
jgi:hypothetical protein